MEKVGERSWAWESLILLEYLKYVLGDLVRFRVSLFTKESGQNAHYRFKCPSNV